MKMSKKSMKENEYAYIYYEGKKVSKNAMALRLFGYRNEGHPGANALFEPGELGYACPICKGYGYNLHWSEYAGFVWCADCNLDIPSCLCVKYQSPHLKGCRPLSKKMEIMRATEMFLGSVANAVERGVVKGKWQK